MYKYVLIEVRVDDWVLKRMNEERGRLFQRRGNPMSLSKFVREVLRERYSPPTKDD